MHQTRMKTAAPYHLVSLYILPTQFVEGNGMEEVVGSIPTRSTNPSSYFSLGSLDFYTHVGKLSKIMVKG